MTVFKSSKVDTAHQSVTVMQYVGPLAVVSSLQLHQASTRDGT